MVRLLPGGGMGPGGRSVGTVMLMTPHSMAVMKLHQQNRKERANFAAMKFHEISHGMAWLT